ncbi:MAG: hypothetical protein K2H34_01220, partial [Lachnospiraceae bacterium]|nr:hypothetical protein [Lachnospiraceae bacterium]
MKNKKIFKKILAVMLCISILTVTVAVEPVQAERAPGESAADYINRCYNRITSLTALNPRPRIIARAYLVGEDDMATASWLNEHETHDMYAVDPGTPIQGHIYNSEYYPQDNMDYIRDIKDNYENNYTATNRIYHMPKGVQYIESEGEMFKVVACDEEWVTIWDNGWQAWWVEGDNLAFTSSCIHTVVDGYMATHPPGFYKIQRNKVWLDFGFAENHPYNSEAAIPKAGNGVVTKLTKLRPFPNEDEKTDRESTPVYALPTGTEVNVVSTQLVPSETPGSTAKYYKVSFNGSQEVQNNGTGYLKYEVPGVYYLDSRYLNFTQKGIKTPDGAVPGEITNVTSGSEVYVYKSKDTGSERI